MKLLTLLLVFVVIATAILLLFARKLLAGKAARTSDTGYELRPEFLTAAERSFAGALDGALPNELTWFSKGWRKGSLLDS